MNLLEFFAEKNKYASLKAGFEQACADNDCKFNIFCKDSKNNDIFSCLHNAGKSLPKIAILSGLHGDEPGGPHGILDFLKNGKLYKNKNILTIPILNPYGIEKNIRVDAARKDLNRQWDSNDRKIVLRTKKIISKFNPNLLLSLHEDQNVNGFYLYPSKQMPLSATNKIQKFLLKSLDPIVDGKIYGDTVKDGIVFDPNVSKPKHRNSMEYFFEKQKIPNITIELPSKIALDKRSKIYCDLLGHICSFIN